MHNSRVLQHKISSSVHIRYASLKRCIETIRRHMKIRLQILLGKS
jgi:hypothetical protein